MHRFLAGKRDRDNETQETLLGDKELHANTGEVALAGKERYPAQGKVYRKIAADIYRHYGVNR